MSKSNRSKLDSEQERSSMEISDRPLSLYKQPNLSHSTPAIGSNRKLLKKESKSIFSLFQEKKSEKVGSLLRVFGTKKKPPKQMEEVDIYKPIDFKNAQQAQVREWDSLSVDELWVKSETSPTLSRKPRRSMSENSRDQVPDIVTKVELLQTPKEPVIEIKSAPTLTKSLSIPIPNSNFGSSKPLSPSGMDTFRNPISISPIKISPLSTSPTKYLSLDFTKPIETEENLYDMKKWLMQKEHTVPEAIAVQVATSPEHAKSLTLNRSTSATQPKFFSLDWSKPILPEDDLFDMKKWLTVDEPQTEPVIPVTLVRRTSVKRSQYSDSYVAISASDAEKAKLEHIDENVELLTETLQATKVVEDDIDSVLEPVESVEPAIETIEPMEPMIQKGVLPDYPVPEPVFLNQDPLEVVPAKPWLPNEFPSHEPDPAVFATTIPQYKTTPINRLTLVTAPGDKKKQGWSWVSKLFPKKEKPIEQNSFEYPKEQVPPNRLSAEEEKEVYATSHLKLAQIDRPLLQQVQISNLMMYILSVHSAVTIKGRGPQRKTRKGKKRKPRLLMDAMPEEKQVVRKVVPKETLVKLEVEEEEDDIPLAMLQKRT